MMFDSKLYERELLKDKKWNKGRIDENLDEKRRTVLSLSKGTEDGVIEGELIQLDNQILRSVQCRVGALRLGAVRGNTRGGQRDQPPQMKEQEPEHSYILENNLKLTN